MNAATAALVGAVIGVGGTALGILGNALLTLINRHFDERKARRELMIKTAWDYYSIRLQTAMERWAKTGEKTQITPFSTFLFHTMQVVDLALRKNLSNHQIAEEMRKIGELERELIKIAKNE